MGVQRMSMEWQRRGLCYDKRFFDSNRGLEGKNEELVFVAPLIWGRIMSRQKSFEVSYAINGGRRVTRSGGLSWFWQGNPFKKRRLVEKRA